MKKTILFFLLVLIVSSCSDNQPKQITEVRTVSPVLDHTSGHGMSECPSEAMSGMKMAAAHATKSSPFSWTLPESWSEQTPTPIRIANFGVASDPAVECYISELTGTAGGIAANVNRWRQQMGQSVLTDEEVNSLSTITVLDIPASYIEIEGDFTGMSGNLQSGFMMLAIICPLQENTVFVKMTGPASTVHAEKENFKEFCRSLRKGVDHKDGAA